MKEDKQKFPPSTLLSMMSGNPLRLIFRDTNQAYEPDALIPHV